MEGRLKMGSAMSVVGPSQCGKTVFIINLLKVHKLLFTEPVAQIHWYTGIFQHDLMKKLKSEIADINEISVYQGIPTNFEKIGERNIIVLDDLMLESEKSISVTHLFTKTVHHKNCFLINIAQNLFLKGRDSRTRSLSTHYLILFKNPRDMTQIGFLSRQMNNKFLKEAFFDAVGLAPYSYLFLDFHQKTPEAMQVRTRILPHESPQYAYVRPESVAEIINNRADVISQHQSE